MRRWYRYLEWTFCGVDSPPGNQICLLIYMFCQDFKVPVNCSSWFHHSGVLVGYKLNPRHRQTTKLSIANGGSSWRSSKFAITNQSVDLKKVNKIAAFLKNLTKIWSKRIIQSIISIVVAVQLAQFSPALPEWKSEDTVLTTRWCRNFEPHWGDFFFF